MQKVRYESVALAIGAFVTAEMEACMAEPFRLIVEPDQPLCREFDMWKFEAHFAGLLSDLLYLCASSNGEPVDALKYKGPVVLVYAMAEELWQRRGDRHVAVHEEANTREWQACAQGYVRIEVVS